MQDASNQDQGHAYHYNLPPQYMDGNGVPFVIKYANNKAKEVVETAFSIQLSADLVVVIGTKEHKKEGNTVKRTNRDGASGQGDFDDNGDKSGLVSLV